MDTNTKNEISFLAKPLAILGLLVALFAVVLTIGMKQISSLRSKISSNQKNQKVLQQKVSTLESVGEILSGDTTFLDVVLPNKGAVLYGLSQIKSQAVLFNLTLSSLKTGISVPEKEGVFKTGISFEVEGEEQSIYTFLDSFSTALPLMNVDKVSLNKSAGAARASVSVSVFSSELPKKIPSVSEAVKELSSDEINLLRELSEYSMPQFVEPSFVPDKADRFDPFN